MRMTASWFGYPVWSKIEIVVGRVGYPASASPCCSSRVIFPRAIRGGATVRRAIGGTDGVGTPPPSRPREFHPEPLTEPGINLSIFPARATAWKAAAFRHCVEFLLLPVDPTMTPVTCL
jgi:hypothetical protein